MGARGGAVGWISLVAPTTLCVHDKMGVCMLCVSITEIDLVAVFSAVQPSALSFKPDILCHPSSVLRGSNTPALEPVRSHHQYISTNHREALRTPRDTRTQLIRTRVDRVEQWPLPGGPSASAQSIARDPIAQRFPRFFCWSTVPDMLPTNSRGVAPANSSILHRSAHECAA